METVKDIVKTTVFSVIIFLSTYFLGCAICNRLPITKEAQYITEDGKIEKCIIIGYDYSESGIFLHRIKTKDNIVINVLPSRIKK